MKVKELINLVDKYYPVYSVYDAEDIIKKYASKVAGNLYPDKHRWYEISTDVYKCDDGYIGVTGPSQLYSECNTWKDLDYPCFLSEFVAVTTVTYKQKA